MKLHVLGCPLNQICRSNLKGWSSDAIANTRSFVYFCASIRCPSHNFENSQCLANSTELWTTDIARSSKQQWKWGDKSHENPVPVCISRDAIMEHLLAGRYQAVWGCAVRKKSWWWRAVWGKVCYKICFLVHHVFEVTLCAWWDVKISVLCAIANIPVILKSVQTLKK